MDIAKMVSSTEKQSPIREESRELSDSTSIEIAEANGFDQRKTKKLIRKLDWNLIPFLSLIYLLCFLDRTNVGNARLVHLEKDLKLVGIQYNIALAVLFPVYIAAEIPSNMMMKRFRPSLWLAFIMVFWAVAMICQGFVKNYSGLLATRIFLGLFEGGLFPGVNYYITQWYRRHECGFRMAVFFSAATLAGAFGGILARGISEMEGVGGIAAWAWIFILEGIATLLVAFTAPWIINDYPSTAKFLSQAERDEVERRLKADHNSLSNEYNTKYVFDALKDWKIYIHMLICMAGFCPIYSISLFLPTIIRNMGYSANSAQLMSVPPYVAACFFTIIASYAADKAKQRGVFMLGFQATAVLGFSMLVGTGKPHVQYAGTFFAAIGIYPQIPLGMAWNGNNIGGSLKRGVGIAMQVGCGNVGGIIASFVYLTKDSPRFTTGHSILIGISTLAFCLTSFMTVYLRRENARRDGLARERGLMPQDYTEEQKMEEREKGDNASYFRYTI
ncbi:high-affinity nicotinic acid transporter [Phlyctema vagabunda]|uniref:High-affinity nicotinic acid transporter n=1 Tax=Phlyctema vagabunda TaxID=108571 RepID=A0ABR4PVZ0_9HELO